VLRGKNKRGDQANQKKLADHRLVRTGNAHRNTPGGIGIGCLHLQFAERLPSARRGGKLPAQVKSVNSGCADNQQRSLFVAAIPNPSRLPRAKFFHTPFLFFAPTRVLHFLSQGKFFVVIEN
jgi:hypothetical protein